MATADITRELDERPTRPREDAAEVLAMRRIGAAFGGSVEGIFDVLAEEAMRLCGGGSAGLTLAERLPGGGLTVRWNSMTGIIAGHEAPQIAWHESIGGAGMQKGAPILFRDPARVFPRLGDVHPRIREALAVPVPGAQGGLQPGTAGEGSTEHGASGRDQPQGDAPIGAVWVALHEGAADGVRGGFDREDVRMLTALAVFAGAGAVAAKLHTESRAARAEAERISGTLRKSNEELERFASIASHDLKEPLRGIRMLAELVSMDDAATLSVDADAKLTRIGALCGHLSGMVDDLLEYAQAGGERPMQPCDLDGLVRRVAETMRESGAEITIHRGLPAVLGDCALLERMFANLIANAVRHNDAEIKRVEIGAAGDEVFVRDNGLGIEARHHAHVFDLFRKLGGQTGKGPGAPDAAALRNRGGTGLGLALVKRIVERHGGSIRLESEPGKGSTFFIRFPRA